MFCSTADFCFAIIHFYDKKSSMWTKTGRNVKLISNIYLKVKWMNNKQHISHSFVLVVWRHISCLVTCRLTASIPYFPQQIAGWEVGINICLCLFFKLVFYGTHPKSMHKFESIKNPLGFISFSNVSDLSPFNIRRTEHSDTQNAVYGTSLFVNSKDSQL